MDIQKEGMSEIFNTIIFTLNLPLSVTNTVKRETTDFFVVRHLPKWIKLFLRKFN